MVVKVITKVYTKEGMSKADAVNYQLTKHAPLFKRLFGALIKKYVISVVVNADGEDVGYQSSVEMWLDNMQDVQKVMSSPEFKQQIQPDHANFARKITMVVFQEHTLI